MRQIFRSDWSLLLVLWAATLGSVALISAATLFPFDFDFRRVSLWEYFHSFRYLPSSFRDVPENLLLFFPAGYCIAALLSRSTVGVARLLFRTGCTAFGVTSLVETLQLFLPSRVSNVSDLLANTCGAVLGATGFRIVRARRYWVEQLTRGFPATIGATTVVLYFCVSTLLLVFLSWGMHPRNWDPSYKLACGNELTGDRPWSGLLADILILDDAVEPFEASQIIAGTVPLSLSNAVLASYHCNGEWPVTDSAKKSPALVPASQPPSIGNNHIELGAGTWLSSRAGMAEVSARVNRNKEFTIAFSVAPFDAAQSGPARIISISESTIRRNLTVGQELTDLVLRWRSPLQGENGAAAQARFAEVFQSHNEVQRLVISFDKKGVRLFRTNGIVATLPITPALGLCALLYEDKTHSIVVGSSFRTFNVLLCLMISVPIGFALGCSQLEFNCGRDLCFTVTAAFGMAVLQQLLVACWGGTKFSLWMAMVNFSLVAFSFIGISRARYFLERRSSAVVN